MKLKDLLLYYEKQQEEERIPLQVELARIRGQPDPRPNAPGGFFLFGPKGYPWLKERRVDTAFCDACEPMLPGVLFPTDFDDACESVDGRVFIARCDACRLFGSDIDAAQFLRRVTDWPLYKLYDNEFEPHYRPFFKVTIQEALHLCIGAIRRK